jgi:hypothetical protein
LKVSVSTRGGDGSTAPSAGTALSSEACAQASDACVHAISSAETSAKKTSAKRRTFTFSA